MTESNLNEDEFNFALLLEILKMATEIYGKTTNKLGLFELKAVLLVTPWLLGWLHLSYNCSSIVALDETSLA